MHADFLNTRKHAIEIGSAKCLCMGRKRWWEKRKDDVREEGLINDSHMKICLHLVWDSSSEYFNMYPYVDHMSNTAVQSLTSFSLSKRKERRRLQKRCLSQPAISSLFFDQLRISI